MKIPNDVPWRSTGKTLGRGGQGDVHVVVPKDEPGGKQRALKVLRNDESAQARRRFNREIQTVKNSESDFIVRVIDHSEEDDQFQYYVMEYHEGASTLEKIMLSSDNPYYGNPEKSLRLFEQIVLAIRDCQSASPPVVHRDIKPSNILVLGDDTIRLIDFGICQIQDGTMITLADENVGARNYTPPECESGNEDSVSFKSDIYSAAKVLWSAITSKRAFAREAPVFNDSSMQRIFPTQPETWHLSRIFEKAIRFNPGDRAHEIDEMLYLIREVRYVMDHGFPPLDEAASRCPSCGFKNIGDFHNGHAVFGNPNPRGVKSAICHTCGFGFVRNVDILRENVERYRNLS